MTHRGVVHHCRWWHWRLSPDLSSEFAQKLGDVSVEGEDDDDDDDHFQSCQVPMLPTHTLTHRLEKEHI